MTVKQLIEALQKLPKQDQQIVTSMTDYLYPEGKDETFFVEETTKQSSKAVPDFIYVLCTKD